MAEIRTDSAHLLPRPNTPALHAEFGQFEEDSLTELSSEDGSFPIVGEESGLTNGKVPKPGGEVGRPGRGGYNLRNELGWEKAKYDAIKV